jgi:hypothetical protein
VVGKRRRIVHQERGIGADALAVPSAEEATDRLPGRLAEDVPEGDVDPADGMGERTAAPHPEGVLVEFLADALRLKGVLVPPERFEDIERGLDQIGVGEDTADAGDAFVGKDGDEGVDAVLRFQLVHPPPLRGGTDQTDGADVADLHVVVFLPE